MNIAIIGTAGRESDGEKLTRDSFPIMYSTTQRIIRSQIGHDSFTLISGGAAWADHVAVSMFILGNSDGLILELPCELTDTGRFVDTGVRDFKKNPGGTANYYHELFSKKVGFDSFDHLKRTKEYAECTTSVGNGFFERNSKIAESADYCIALTFGNGAELKDGGTADTMKKFLKKGSGKSFHVDLNDWKVYSPAIVK